MNLHARFQPTLHRQAYGNPPMVHREPCQIVRSLGASIPAAAGRLRLGSGSWRRSGCSGRSPGMVLGRSGMAPPSCPARSRMYAPPTKDAAAVDSGPRQEIHRRNAGEPGDTQLRGAIVDCRRRARLAVRQRPDPVNFCCPVRLPVDIGPWHLPRPNGSAWVTVLSRVQICPSDSPKARRCRTAASISRSPMAPEAR